MTYTLAYKFDRIIIKKYSTIATHFIGNAMTYWDTELS